MPELQDRQAAQALLRGMNTMQMQAGLMPGGIPTQPAPMLQPLQPMAHPAQFSSGLMLQFQQQQQLAQLTLPPMQFGGMTPMGRPMGLMQPLPPVGLPGPQFGYGHAMARQQALIHGNQNLAMMQGGMGLGFRGAGLMGSAGIGALGGALLGAPMGPAGMLLGGVAGATAFEHFGLGQSFQNFGNQLMTPMIQARHRQLELQQMSMGFVRSGADLSPLGTGLSAAASMRLNNGLMNMADSRGFQQETGGMFNRQDVMKITRLAGQFGMLDQSRTADEIRQNVGKISRALANFMKLAEEPDVQEAMRMMSNMRSLGMNFSESSVATRNARQFARMAGTDMRGIMQAGMQGAGIFQSAGLSGAAGLNAGMAATGMAGQMAGLMSPARLAMAGGREGIASALMGGAAQSGTLDAMLPMMLMRRNGQLAIDQSALMDLAQGRMSIQDAMRQGGTRIQQLGGREALMELSTRRRELQDEAQRSLGGQGQVLLPLMMARAIAAGTPGMTMGGALRTLGMGEQQARTIEQMAQDPRFWASMRQQQEQTRIEERRDMQERARRLEEDARMPSPIRRGLEPLRTMGRRGSTFVDNFMEDWAAGQDAEEAASLSGGRLLRASRSALSSDVNIAHGRDALRRDPSGFAAGSRRDAQAVGAMIRAEDARAGSLDAMRANYPLALTNPNMIVPALASGVANQFAGPNGFGLTAGTRGGEFVRETVMSQESIMTQAMHRTGIAQVMGQGRTDEQVRERARSMQRMGRMMDSTRHLSIDHRDQIRDRARESVGQAMTDDDFQTATETASAAINEYLEGRTISLGVTTIQRDVDEQEMQNQVRRRLRETGRYTEDQITRIVQSQEFMRGASTHGERRRSPQAQAAAEAHAEAGGNVGAATTAQTADQYRRLATRRREAALERIGAGGGSGVSREEQRRLSELLGGGGTGGQARRELAAIRALEATVSRGGPGAAAANAQLNRLQRSFNQRSRSARRDAEAMLGAEGLAGLDADELASMGSRLAGSSDLQGDLAALGGVFEGANRADVEAAGAEMLGGEAFQQFQEYGARGLQGILANGGTIDGLTDDQRQRLLDADTDEERSAIEAEIRRSFSNRAGAGGRTTASGGRRSFTEALADRDLAGMFDSIQNWATQGGQAPAAGPATPQTFEQAVTTFSEASAQLLQAAEAMNSGGAMSSINGVMMAASVGMTPLPGALGILPSIAGALFGGGDGG